MLQIIRTYYKIPTFQTKVWGSYYLESNIQYMSFSLFFKPNNDWILSWGKSTSDMLVARLPLIFGENCASTFCGSMCSNNRSNTFSRYSIPNAHRNIFIRSYIPMQSNACESEGKRKATWLIGELESCAFADK